eukprot:scaffold1328_cov394-Prasinococcus_capsulatus_cf.AAC.7
MSSVGTRGTAVLTPLSNLPSLSASLRSSALQPKGAALEEEDVGHGQEVLSQNRLSSIDSQSHVSKRWLMGLLNSKRPVPLSKLSELLGRAGTAVQVNAALKVVHRYRMQVCSFSSQSSTSTTAMLKLGHGFAARRSGGVLLPVQRWGRTSLRVCAGGMCGNWLRSTAEVARAWYRAQCLSSSSINSGVYTSGGCAGHVVDIPEHERPASPADEEDGGPPSSWLVFGPGLWGCGGGSQRVQIQ